MSDVKCVLIHDHFQNAKSYNIPRAQLIISDIPYNIGREFYASRPDWYEREGAAALFLSAHLQSCPVGNPGACGSHAVYLQGEGTPAF